MEMSGQLRSPAASPPQKELQYPGDEETILTLLGIEP
jgi:hypothetical protein